MATGRAGRVGEFEGDGLRAPQSHANPQGGGADGVEPDVVPGEREPSGVLHRHEHHGVQRGVEQGRVQVEGVGGGVGGGGQADLGKDLLAARPHPGQSLEERAVEVARSANAS